MISWNGWNEFSRAHGLPAKRSTTTHFDDPRKNKTSSCVIISPPPRLRVLQLDSHRTASGGATTILNPNLFTTSRIPLALLLQKELKQCNMFCWYSELVYHNSAVLIPFLCLCESYEFSLLLLLNANKQTVFIHASSAHACACPKSVAK